MNYLLHSYYYYYYLYIRKFYDRYVFPYIDPIIRTFDYYYHKKYSLTKRIQYQRSFNDIYKSMNDPEDWVVINEEKN